MRALLLAVILLPALSSQAQYYYKDILGTRESSDLIKSYMKNKVNQVVVNSFDGSDQKDDQFYVEQQFSPASLSLKTTTRSGMTDQSILVSYVDASGNVIKTVDSSDEVVNITSYNYDANGRLVTVNS